MLGICGEDEEHPANNKAAAVSGIPAKTELKTTYREG